MDKAKYNTHRIKLCCQRKLGVNFGKTRGDHFNGWVMFNNVRKVRITIAKGRTAPQPKTYKSMAKQLLLSVREFNQLISCVLSRIQYAKLVEQRFH